MNNVTLQTTATSPRLAVPLSDLSVPAKVLRVEKKTLLSDDDNGGVRKVSSFP